jgi:hypothetical protein
VGDTTIGMAHPSQSYSSKDKIFYKIPFLRSEHPVTGADWEGTGVIPDIVTDPESALEITIEETKKILGAKKKK